MGDNYAQGHSVSLPHQGRVSTILKLLQTGKPVDCRLCGGFCLFSCTGKGNLSGRNMQTDLGLILLRLFFEKNPNN